VGEAVRGVHGRRHPTVWARPRSGRFLDHLAEGDGVRCIHQNQAVAALLFLYEAVFGVGG